MVLRVKPSSLQGTLSIPSSKSHSIRAALIASLAEGESYISNFLLSQDGKSALDASIGIGAEVSIEKEGIRIRGVNGNLSGGSDFLDFGNSGTSMRLFTAAASLGGRLRSVDGDSSLRTRLMKPLLSALENLGAVWKSNQGERDIPFTIQGPIHGGPTRVAGLSSQFLSALLFSTPLLNQDTHIEVENLRERPYVAITRWWLDQMGIKYEYAPDDSWYRVSGRQRYLPFRKIIPADFSSACFGAVGAAITGGPITLTNLDWNDPQGDKEVFSILEKMGISVVRDKNGTTISASDTANGQTIDLNAMPDALPVLSVLGCFAKGETNLVNVPQARFKECDRIAVMTAQLSKMGGRIIEHKDGMTIFQSQLHGTQVESHGDHRISMALALAGLGAKGETYINEAECYSVTYPDFVEDFNMLGAKMEWV